MIRSARRADPLSCDRLAFSLTCSLLGPVVLRSDGISVVPLSDLLLATSLVLGDDDLRRTAENESDPAENEQGENAA